MKKALKLPTIVAMLLASVLCVSCGKGTYDEASRIAVMHEGRVETLDAFARSQLRLITGRERWKRQPALKVLLDGLKDPALLSAVPWIEIEYPDLKKELGLNAQDRYFKFSDLAPVRMKVISLAMSASKKRGDDERPTKTEQKAERLISQMDAVQDLISGGSITVIPPAGGGTGWVSPFSAPAPFEPDFKTLTAAHAADPARFEKLAHDWNANVDRLTSGAHRTTL